ncbi:hypothetical protein ASPCAL09748 [Aspergillus calidoustus]|uniref:Uncharacterized protein n=1 Tax=Aspergillus calidoustus TaxID=454130 RepID=A0A0U5GA85_ASPCI|nr:hypothetical protein ASPCAL09748 [Aspergillus calidoustus]
MVQGATEASGNDAAIRGLGCLQSGTEVDFESSEIEIDGDDFSSEEEFELSDGFDAEDSDTAHENVEDHEYNVSMSGGDISLKITLFTTKELDSPGWVENLCAECNRDGVLVGNVLARLIWRGAVRPQFWQRMEELSQDTSDIALKIFNRYGIVKPNLKHHPIQKGSGVWQTELDNGPLATIEYVHVIPSDLRRKGLGSKMLELLLAKAQGYIAAQTQTDPSLALFQTPQSKLDCSSSLHVLTLPGWLRADVEPRREGQPHREQHRINSEAHDAAVSFFRSCGFRRLGISGCFAYSFQPNHPSRTLLVNDDVDPPFCAVDEYEGFINPENGETMQSNMERYRLDSLKASHPFHHAAETLSDEDCLTFLKYHASSVGSALPNNTQSTLLHSIARAIKPRSLQWIIDNVQEARKWQSSRDMQGFTPIEALKEKLESSRSTRQVMLMTLIVSDQFKGFGTEAVWCLELLSTRDGNSTRLSTLELQRLKYGCTCGSCLEGFLSPRMAFALYWKGGELGDMLSDFSMSDGKNWVEWHEDAIAYLARDVQANLQTNKSLRCGFGNTFSLAAHCLERKIIPRTPSILEQLDDEGEWPPHTKNFFKRAGVDGVNAALLYLLEATEMQDEMAGDGESRLLDVQDYTKLPLCRNDHEFGFVSVSWGLRDDYPLY